VNPAARNAGVLFAYHEATAHTPERLRRAPHTLDWANMPDPFRHYEGVPLLDLPASAPAPRARMLEVLRGAPGPPVAEDGPGFLSSLFFHSAAISAAKRAPSGGYRYALRVNPSSGNLHPTEFHFLARGLRGWPDGCYHYRPSSHTAERRGAGDWSGGLSAAPVVVLLSSIAWREAWKYRARAYRYVNHDIGHAWQAVHFAARALGCDARARGVFIDREIAAWFGLAPDEWPMLLVEIGGPGVPVESRPSTPREWFGGSPNRLSAATVDYPAIGELHAASCLEGLEAPAPVSLPPGEEPPPGGIALPAPADTPAGFAQTVRRRRSALDFIGGTRAISAAQFAALLDAAARPFANDWAGRFAGLWAYVHRVEGLAPGLYRCHLPSLTLALREAGDLRLVAAALSLGQDLAANSCVTFSISANLGRAAEAYGARAYRYCHWEAGAIGQRLYLASEALGFNSTGIGAFYDFAARRALGLDESGEYVVYHFTCGYAVPDPRLGP
jgi:SagB-type dehydrogenase family enzyme